MFLAADHNCPVVYVSSHRQGLFKPSKPSIRARKIALRRQWSCWQVLLQYLDLHLTHRGASWASGAAQAAHVVRIILRFAVSFGLARRLDSAW